MTDPQDIWIAPDAIFDGAQVLCGMALRLQHDAVTDIAPTPAGSRRISGTITPGFIDLQVNGGGGVMVNSTPTADGMRAIAAAHRICGTTAILPTVITDRPQVLEAAIDATLACAGTAGLVGLHIEGPHIAMAKRGTHAADHIRPLDDRTITQVRRLRDAQVAVMITLAPEMAALPQIAELAGMGAIVSLGHTDASAEDIDAAIAAGATCGTHLLNAMSQMTARAAGAVGALINSDCYTGIICDGHHVSDAMVALAIRARPRPDRMFTVSDAMATVGGPDDFDLYGQRIALHHGKLVNAEGNLAGAHLTQGWAIKRLVHQIGLPLEQALRMAITTPAACMHRPDLARLVGRPAVDVMVLDPDLSQARSLAAVASLRH